MTKLTLEVMLNVNDQYYLDHGGEGTAEDVRLCLGNNGFQDVHVAFIEAD